MQNDELIDSFVNPEITYVDYLKDIAACDQYWECLHMRLFQWENTLHVKIILIKFMSQFNCVYIFKLKSVRIMLMVFIVIV